MPNKKGSQREMIEPHSGDKRYVRRGPSGQFTGHQVDVGKSLSRDRQSTAKRTVPKGQGNRGDQQKAP